MEVTRENIDDLNALLTVSITKEDYQENVDKALQNYRKNANLKGFRKGKVPMGIIKRQYGSTVLGDELNRLVSKGLNDFINENKLDILGEPLPKNDIPMKGDFENPDSFEFVYEIGLSPEFETKLSAKNKFNYTKVKVDKALIDKQVEDLTRRYGKLISAEEVGEKDMILGQLVELDGKKEIKEGGIMNNSTISMEFVEDEKTKKTLKGKKVGDKIEVNPFNISRGGKDTASMLGIDESELENISDKFQLTITEVKTMEPAELNQELFDKLFGEGNVTSEKELRVRVKDDLEKMFANDSDKILTRRITNHLVEKANISLPDEFLKRWIFTSQNSHNHNHNHDGHHHHHVTMEEVEEQYDDYAQGLKWQLVQNNIFKTNNLKVEQEEVLEHTKGLLANQYQQYGIPLPDDKELAQSAGQVLSNQEEAQRIYNDIAERKMLNFFKETVKLTEEEVDYDKFLEIAKDKNG
ncbi:MAG: trigger factor [Brumimicrobium sp.]